jgi:translation initiation factor 1
MRRKERISTDAKDTSLSNNPFAVLDIGGLPENRSTPKPKSDRTVRNKGIRLEMRRVKAGKGGKTVTEIKGFQSSSIGESTLKRLKQTMGTGGTFKEGVLELQGDVREKAEAFLQAEGYKVVRSGG